MARGEEGYVRLAGTGVFVGWAWVRWPFRINDPWVRFGFVPAGAWGWLLFVVNGLRGGTEADRGFDGGRGRGEADCRGENNG